MNETNECRVIFAAYNLAIKAKGDLTSMVGLDQLEEVDLRAIWSHETSDFTPWLAKEDNIAILADTLGLDGITVEETESSVGNFKVDIYASETGSDRTIVIENQIEDSNHDHLGKLLTYAAGKSANVIIWIVKNAREEHRAAIEWLNKHSDEDVGFYLCEVKLYRIGNSKPAVKFDVIERPNNWSREVRNSDAMNETQQQRYEYWTALMDYAFQNEDFAREFNRRTPTTDHWMDFSIGRSVCYLQVTQKLRDNKIGVGLCINKNGRELSDMLSNDKEIIESEAQMNFDWRFRSDNSLSGIFIKKSVALTDRTQWNAQFDWIIDVMLRMKETFTPYL